MTTCPPRRPATLLPSLRHRASPRGGRWRDPTQRDNMGSVGSTSRRRLRRAKRRAAHGHGPSHTASPAWMVRPNDQLILASRPRRPPRTILRHRQSLSRLPRRSRSSPAGHSKECSPTTMQLRTPAWARGRWRRRRRPSLRLQPLLEPLPQPLRRRRWMQQLATPNGPTPPSLHAYDATQQAASPHPSMACHSGAPTATPPPSRQPQHGPAAPYHGRLGATTHWGDKVRVEGPANGESLGNDNKS